MSDTDIGKRIGSWRRTLRNCRCVWKARMRQRMRERRDAHVVT